jgi:hypothetical protein
MKTEMGGGEGSTVLPPWRFVQEKIKGWDRGERTERLKNWVTMLFSLYYFLYPVTTGKKLCAMHSFATK